jgi:hypothetical protein
MTTLHSLARKAAHWFFALGPHEEIVFTWKRR